MWSMLLLNFLARKRAQSGMVAGLTISVPFDAQESSASMEEPLNWLLFNKILAMGLCRTVSRSDRFYFPISWREFKNLPLVILSSGHRHRKILEKVVDIDYVLKVFPVCSHLHFMSFLFLRFFHLISSLSSSRRLSASLTNASQLCSLVISPPRSTTAMPAQAKNSPTPQYLSCVLMLPMTRFPQKMVSKEQQQMEMMLVFYFRWLIKFLLFSMHSFLLQPSHWA